jgi:aspartate/methionine/tyrosine aminotransferase
MQIRPFALERYFADHEFTAPYLLCASDVEPYTLAEALALADDETRALWDGLSLGYTETAGLPALRSEIAALYPGLEAQDVLVFGGAEEGIFTFAHAALGRGDHAIVVTPAYQSLHELARSAGATVTTVELEHERGWALDVDAVRRAVSRETRAIVVNFPHNPTGAHIDRATLEELVEIAEEAGAHLFSDEVYRWLEHSPDGLLPGAAELSPRALSLGVMSKTFALPGLRIGWLACRDRDLLDAIAKVRDYTTICASAPSEVLALMALRRRDDVVARSRAIVAANLPLLDDFFARSEESFEWARPGGAAIGFPRLVADAAIEDFARELVDEEGVLILPGSIYEHPGNHFRIGFGRRNMPEALARLERFASARF